MILIQTLFLFNHTGSALKNTCAWFLIKIFLFFTKSHVFCLKNENFQDIQLRKCFQFLLEVLRMCCTQQYLTTGVVYQFRKNTIFLTHFCRQRTDKENACAKFQKKAINSGTFSFSKLNIQFFIAEPKKNRRRIN